MILEKSRRNQSVLVLVALLAAIAHQSEGRKDLCRSKNTCSSCIQTENCGWCEAIQDFRGRCLQEEHSYKCPDELFHYPQNLERIFLNNELTEVGEVSNNFSANSYHHNRYHHYLSPNKVVQIKPQSIKLDIGINQKHFLRVSISPAMEYPVDLYFLSYMSESMELKIERLSEVIESISNITSDLRFGFGSYMENAKSNGYGYRHMLSLTTDKSQFLDAVKNAYVPGKVNVLIDGSEGLMQAMACREHIGWRGEARRLIVFLTDTGFQTADDGKLGIPSVPNDGECHLSKGETYTHSALQDYPSISQINRKVKDNAINIIFAVTANQMSLYEKLVQDINGCSVAKLDSDLLNLADLVQDEYTKILSSVEVMDNATADLSISYFSSCLSNGPALQTSKCHNVSKGQTVTFHAEVEMHKCPEDPRDWKQIISIAPIGIKEEMRVELEMLCMCPCERPGSYGFELNSNLCNQHGTSMCGMCQCEDNYIGRTCKCSATDKNYANTSDIPLEIGSCRPDNTTTIDCFGRGSCVCGECECHARKNPEEEISGQFCECDNFSCARNRGQICSGPDHGTCECGRCRCQPGWSGDDCGLRSDPERCDELKQCVQCQMYKTGTLKNDEDCARNCVAFAPLVVDNVDIGFYRRWQTCTFFDEDHCEIKFKYSEQGGGLQVYAQENRTCSLKPKGTDD